MTPTLGRIRRTTGIAGQIAYIVPVTYPGEKPGSVQFLGSTYAPYGPVVMVTPAFADGVFVDDPGRFGPFGPSWVRRFFGKES